MINVVPAKINLKTHVGQIFAAFFNSTLIKREVLCRYVNKYDWPSRGRLQTFKDVQNDNFTTDKKNGIAGKEEKI
jgi:hypothetical protein